MTRRNISCFLIVCNEADRIERCLDSLASWVDQLVILDSGSTDGTLEICQRYSQDVFSTDWPGFGAQRNRALKKCRHDWVLNIDADEELSEALKEELDEPTVLQHFNVKGKNDDGFILELQGGLEIKAVEVEQNAKNN